MDTIIPGLAEFFHSSTSSLPGSALHDSSERMIYSTGMDYAPCNGILEKIEPNDIGEKQIAQMIDFFTSRKLPFVWWTGNRILENKGFLFGGTMKGISLNLSEGMPKMATLPSNLKIKIIDNEKDLQSASEIIRDCFGMSSLATEQYLAINNYVMKAGVQIHYLAFKDDIPVGTATLSTTKSCAGIWNFATLPTYRRQGIGTALACAALAEAKKRKYQNVMAVLMPKAMAWGVFINQLGFQEVCPLPFYVYGASNQLEKE